MTTEDRDEDRIRRTVIEAVERIDGPERARLARIEQRLLNDARQRRPHPWWWSLVGLGLAAGVAAAAYWGLHGSDPADDPGAAEPAMRESTTVEPAEPDTGGADGESGGSGGAAEEEEDRIIYIGQ